MELKSGEITDLPLNGPTLPNNTSDLEIINRVGLDLYEKNKMLIKERIPNNWYVVIEPASGHAIASGDQMALYEYTRNHFPNRIFFSIGILGSSFGTHVRRSRHI